MWAVHIAVLWAHTPKILGMFEKPVQKKLLGLFSRTRSRCLTRLRKRVHIVPRLCTLAHKFRHLPLHSSEDISLLERLLPLYRCKECIQRGPARSADTCQHDLRCKKSLCMWLRSQRHTWPWRGRKVCWCQCNRKRMQRRPRTGNIDGSCWDQESIHR